jgi:hypothetical protein
MDSFGTMDETELQMFELWCQRNMPVPAVKHIMAMKMENPPEYEIKASMVWPMIKANIDMLVTVGVHVETLFKANMLDNRRNGGDLSFIYKDLGLVEGK